jgi:hypothetical protein
MFLGISKTDIGIHRLGKKFTSEYICILEN